ncbi:alanine dehydrogenase [Insolitispirillum peregrinum]|uniref:Alanine dehydrogenase n=1 Tax=Insolitispirillum peregrinum TaxID=80876 RepID=A0A1N7JIR0_9PROT|nr:alanine dehydrogenase [Insolitispirillum peregrinum]SIS49136.1 alanine dehydrogenase [Insolitispirillum peregrinum]
MLVGVPREIKTHEYRVGLTAGGVRELVHHGHAVIVEREAGSGAGIDDAAYRAAGAEVVDTAAEVFARADMIVKVKEPQADECRMLRNGQILFTYLHLAADRRQARLLRDSGCVAMAYETVTDDHGGLPLLAPMSEVAGRMAIQAGAHCLEKSIGGRGILLGGVPGVPAAKVVILGAGVVGTNAARVAIGLGAQVTLLDASVARLRKLDMFFGSRLNTLSSSMENIESAVLDADLVVGAVLVPGDVAPKLVSAEMVGGMRRGSVLVDVAIDQGGCFETSHPTTHASPTFVVQDVVHYCVSNMPGAVARTSTFALNNATLPYILELADHGWQAALIGNPHLCAGLNLLHGKITHKGVAHALGEDYVAPLSLLETASA